MAAEDCNEISNNHSESEDDFVVVEQTVSPPPYASTTGTESVVASTSIASELPFPADITPSRPYIENLGEATIQDQDDQQETENSDSSEDIASTCIKSESIIAPPEVKKDDAPTAVCQCDFCADNNAAVCCCGDCFVLLCQICREHHAKARKTSGHTTYPLEELSMLPHLQSFCGEHTDKRLKLFCETCTKSVCRDCAVTSHKQHSCVLAKVALARHREEISKLSATLLEKARTLHEELEKLEGNISALQTQEEFLTAGITAAVEDICKVALKRKEELAASLSELFKGEYDLLSDYSVLLAERLGSIKNTLSQVESTESRCPAPQIIAHLIEVETALKTQISCLPASAPSVSPENVARVHIDTLDVRKRIGNMGTVEEFPLPEKCVAIGEGISAVCDGEYGKFTVSTIGKRGRSLTIGGEKVDISGQVDNIAVKDTGDGKYVVSYYVRKRYPLDKIPITAKIRGNHIAGSPFQVKVIPSCLWSTGSSLFVKTTKYCGWDCLAISKAGWEYGVHTFDVLIKHVNKKDPAGLVVGVAPKCAKVSEYDKYPGLGMDFSTNKLNTTRVVFSMQNGLESNVDRVRVVLDCETHTVYVQRGEKAYAGRLPGSAIAQEWHIVSFLHYPLDSVELGKPGFLAT